MARKKSKKQRTEEVVVVEEAAAPADYSQHPVIPLEVQLERGGTVPSLIRLITSRRPPTPSPGSWLPSGALLAAKLGGG